jgi:protoporphyrin/coproporphyrin ferrochelatase
VEEELTSIMGSADRIAVVLFNLGGPDSLASVEPFLRNLFTDPAIIALPAPIRQLVGRFIARRRGPVAREIYARIGGSSPLLSNTEAQAAALRDALADTGEAKVFSCMRYWHPMSDAVARAVKAFSPDRVVLLPLYPQFSTTTTASSLRVWQASSRKVGLVAPAQLVCCYPTAPGFVTAAAALVQRGISEAAATSKGPIRVLFSAHGLPKKVIRRGDPYETQVRSTAQALARRLGLADGDWVVCFQSRVGPLEWIEPYTDDEIRRAGREGVSLVVFPVAFVSEHSETLVELDMDYRLLAEQSGVSCYIRVPTVSTEPAFITALADIVRVTLASSIPVRSEAGRRLCAAGDRCCMNLAA